MLFFDFGGVCIVECKFKEVVLVYQVDWCFNKDQIFNVYFNVIYWGDGGLQDIIGVGVVVWVYFKKEFWDFNFVESVYLVIIIFVFNCCYKDFIVYCLLMKLVFLCMVEDG